LVGEEMAMSDRDALAIVDPAEKFAFTSAPPHVQAGVRCGVCGWFYSKEFVLPNGRCLDCGRVR
jgi:hypothetical protein